MTSEVAPPLAGVAGARRPRLSRIVVATDGSAHADRAVDAALDLAARAEAGVDVVVAWDASVAGAGAAIAPPELWARAEQEARGLLRETAAQVCGSARLCGTHLLDGRASRRITEVADEVCADLVVVGSRGLGRVRRFVLGSTSDEVLQTSRRAVVVVRGGAGAWPPRAIVAAHDGSPAAHDAACLAAVVADTLGIPLRLLGVAGGAHAEPWTASSPEGLRRVLESAATRIADRVGIAATVEVSRGEAGQELLAAASDARTLVAMGASDHDVRARRRLGRTASAVAHGARGSMLVVPRSLVRSA